MIKTINIRGKEYICLERLNPNYKNKILLYKWVNKEEYEFYIRLFNLLKKETI